MSPARNRLDNFCYVGMHMIYNSSPLHHISHLVVGGLNAESRSAAEPEVCSSDCLVNHLLLTIKHLTYFFAVALCPSPPPFSNTFFSSTISG